MRKHVRENWRTHKAWSTHMPLLLRTVSLADGPVIELGGGLYSTPLLHWLCKEKGLKLTSYENTDDFYDYEHGFQSRSHSVRRINDWEEVPVDRHYGVVFIDQHPEEARGESALRFKDCATFVVLHDSNHEEHFGYDKIWKHFKYRYDWKDCVPWTTVVSNFIDVGALFNAK